MKKLLFLLMLVFITGIAFAQLTGDKAIPGDYATIAAAVTELNTQGVGAGGVTFKVDAGHTESIDAPILVTATGTAANPIVFQKSGDGANPLITRTDAGLLSTSTLGGQGDAVIIVQGSDYLTFDGIDLAASQSGIEYGYYIRKASATDGSKYVTIKNLVVTMTKGTSAYVTGIYASNNIDTSLVSSAAGVTVTSEGGRHENVTIIGNTIQNVHVGIFLRGFAHSSVPYNFYDQNFVIGQAGAGNTIQNFGGGNTSASYGIYTLYSANLNINYNTFNNTNGGGVNATGTIYAVNPSTANSSSATISYNTVVLTATGTSSSVYGVYNTAGATAASNTINISNNNVRLTNETASASATMTGIYCLASATTVNITANTVANCVLNGTGVFTGIDGGAPVNLNMTGNFVYNNSKTGASGSMFLMRGSTAIVTFQNNNIYNNHFTANSGTTACSLYGYYNFGSPTVENLNNNSIYNLTLNGTNTSSYSLIYGMYSNTTASAVKSCSGNLIYDLKNNNSSTGSANVYGINQALGTTVNITKNKIYGLHSNGASSNVHGLYLSSGTTINVVNNYIGNLTVSNANAAFPVTGIYCGGGTNLNVYYNTLRLNANSTGASFGSAAVYASTSPTLKLRNNILVNTSTPNGATGYSAAYRRSSTTATTHHAESNNNLFWAGTPSANNLIYTDGTNHEQTLAGYKARFASEAASVTENPPFLNTADGENSQWLHIDPTVPTYIEGRAGVIAGITEDYDGNPRSADAPDIGADEGVFTPPAGQPGNVVLLSPAAPNNTAVSPVLGTLTWQHPGEGGTPTSYDVYIAETIDDLFSGYAANVVYPNRSIGLNQLETFNLENETLYYWAVVAKSDELEADVEDPSFMIWSFTTSPRVTIQDVSIGNIWPGTEYSGNIVVNINTESSVTLDLVDGPIEFRFTGLPLTHAGGGAVNVPFTFTAPLVTGAYEEDLVFAETTPAGPNITIQATANVSADNTFGNGTSNLNIPVHPWMGYTYSQTIYPASWFTHPSGHRIESIHYYWNPALAPTNTQDFQVWMGVTTQNNFPSTGASWLPVSGMTLVFDGVWNISAGAGWKELVLQTPFVYDRTQGNLVIAMDENTPSYDNSGNGSAGSFFHGTSSTNYQAIQYATDTASLNPDPLNPTSTPVSKQGYPNTKFVFGQVPLNPELVLSPSTWTPTVSLPATASREFAITNNGQGALQVTSIGFGAGSSDAFTCTDFPAVPFTLNFGDPAETFTVTYAPTTGSLAGIVHDATIVINGTSFVLQGTAIDSRITSVPYTQNFDSVTTPALPTGWVKVGATGSAYTQTSSNYSSPNCLYIYNNAVVKLPEVNLATSTDLRVRFMGRANITVGANIELGYLTDPADPATFVVVGSQTMSTLTYQPYTINIGTVSTPMHYAFRSPNTSNSNLIDDVVLEVIPTTPNFVYSPTTIDFGPTNLGAPTAYRNVAISNTGAGSIVLNAGDISITGTDADQFEVNTTTGFPTNITTNNFNLPVRFNPSRIGSFTAQLVIRYSGTDYSVTLSGAALGESVLLQSFEGATFPPWGWTREDYWYSSSSYAYQGTKSVYRSTSTTAVRMITPLLDLDGTGTVNFSTYVLSNTSQRMQLSYYDTSLETPAWVNFGDELVLVPASWQTHSIALPAITGQYKIGFGAYYATGGTSASVYLDMVWGPNQVMLRPDPVTALTAPTNGAQGQSIYPSLSWTAATTGGQPTAYKVMLGTTNPPTVQIGTDDASPFVITTPLDYGQTYYWSIVPTNTVGDAQNNPVSSFSTVNTVTSVVDNFGSTGTTFTPSGWSRFSGVLANPSTLTSTTTGWVQDDWCNVVTTPPNYSARMEIWSTYKYWLMTPPIVMGDPNMQMEFDLAMTDYSTSASPTTLQPDDRFIVLIGDGQTWSPANILREWNNTGSEYVYNNISNTGSRVTIPLGSYSGVKYIAFYGESTVGSNGDNNVYVDNLKIWVPLTADLAATAINGPRYVVGNGQVTHAVSVTNNGTQVQTNYTVHLKRYGDDRYANTPGLPIQPGETIVHNITWDPSLVGFVPGTYSIVGEVELTGDLNASNDQTAQFSFGVFSEGTYIQDFESGAIPADWTILNADGGTYKWGIYSTGALSGTYCASVRYESSSLVNNDWLITPALQLSADAGDQISFWLGNNSSYPEDWQVLISTTDTEIASFTAIDTGNFASSGYINKVYNLDAYGAAVVYVAIRYMGDDHLRIYADDFICPPLYKPATPELSIEQVPTGVKLTWQAINHARSYQIYASDSPDGTYELLTTVSSLEHTITTPPAKQFYKVVSSTLRVNPRGNMTISRSPEDQARFDYDEAVRNGKIME